VRKISRQGFELLSGLSQSSEYSVGVDLEDSYCASDAQTLSQTHDNAHDELWRGVFAMKDGAMCFGEVPVARYTLKLAPRLAAGMSVGVEVAASEPAVVEAIGLWTKVR